MTAVIPKVVVQIKKTQLINKPGMSGKVAVVGAFDTLETNPKLFETVGEAQTEFGTDTTYNGCACIPYLFKGASSVLAVNITTESSGTRSKTITTQNLTTALAKIKGEDWDILFIAEPLTDTFIPIINSVIHSLTGNNNINATISIKASIILIVLSIILTIIGGLIPSKKASKQDPVVALRTE